MAAAKFRMAHPLIPRKRGNMPMYLRMNTLRSGKRRSAEFFEAKAAFRAVSRLL